MLDMFGLTDGIGPSTENPNAVICDRFIKKVSQMDGDQLANFAELIGFDFNGYSLVLNFRIPVTTDFLNSHLRNTKREGSSGVGNNID